MSQSIHPLLLHSLRRGPNPIKIAIALEFLQIPYNVKVWTATGDPEEGVKGARFLKINENGRTPALEDPNTGVTAWESGACMNYILAVYDTENRLGPRGESIQHRVDFEKWTLFLLTTLGPMSGQCNWFRFYNGVKNENALERYQAQTYRCYGVLEGQLQKTDGASILPGGYTAVDFHYQPWLELHWQAGLNFDKHPLVSKYLQSMKNLKYVKDAYQKIKQAAEQQSVAELRILADVYKENDAMVT